MSRCEERKIAPLSFSERSVRVSCKRDIYGSPPVFTLREASVLHVHAQADFVR